MKNTRLPPITSNRLPPITLKFTDESTAKHFQFTFYCDRCASSRQSPAYPFTEADKVTDFDSFTAAQKLVYDAQYEHAYERANREAIGYFVSCKKCGKYVCEDCALKAHRSGGLCPECSS